jgi:hypothetical protein
LSARHPGYTEVLQLELTNASLRASAPTVCGQATQAAVALLNALQLS